MVITSIILHWNAHLVVGTFVTAAVAAMLFAHMTLVDRRLMRELIRRFEWWYLVSALIVWI
jgi:hypothetical protein